MGLFSILVDISANTAKLESGLQQAQAKIESFASTAKSVAEGVVAFTGLAFSVDAFGRSISKAVESGAQLQQLSERMGASVETLSALKYAAELADVPFDVLAAGLDHFHEILERAEIGSGRAGKALTELGISAKKLIELPFEGQLEAIADRLEKIGNPAERGAIEMILFGEAGAKLDPLLRQGADGIQAMEGAAAKAGVTIDGKMTEALKATHEELIKLDASWSHATTTLAVAFAPAIEGVAALLERLAGAWARAWDNTGPQTNLDAFKQKFTELREEYNSLNEQLEKLEKPGAVAVGWLSKANQIELLKQQIAGVAQGMNEYNNQIMHEIQLQDQAAAGAKKNLDITDPTIALKGVQVDAQKVYTDKMTELLEEFQKTTETDTEKVAASWYKMEAELKDLRDQGLISQEEYASRLSASLDAILPGIEVGKGLKIKQPAEEEFSDMEKLGEKAASGIQQAFANFLFNPFHTNLRKFGKDFLQTLQHMASDAAAARIFKALFGDGSEGGKGAGKHGGESGLGGILGGFLDSMFGGGTGGGSGAGGGQGMGAMLTKAFSGGASGALGGFISSMFSPSFSPSALPSLAPDFADLSANVAAQTGAVSASVAQSVASSLSGSLQSGGDVSPGGTYMVGEAGPELFTAASHGKITPNTDLGGNIHFHQGDTHIDARGADADRIMTALPPILAAHAARTKADLLNAFRRNGLAAPLKA